MAELVGAPHRRRRRASGQVKLDQDRSGSGFFPMFRFCGPAEPFFDKIWKLVDLVEVRWPSGSVADVSGRGAPKAPPTTWNGAPATVPAALKGAANGAP